MREPRAAWRGTCALMQVAQCDLLCVLCLVVVTQGFHVSLPASELCICGAWQRLPLPYGTSRVCVVGAGAVPGAPGSAPARGPRHRQHRLLSHCVGWLVGLTDFCNLLSMSEHIEMLSSRSRNAMLFKHEQASSRELCNTSHPHIQAKGVVHICIPFIVITTSPRQNLPLESCFGYSRIMLSFYS